MLHEHPESPQGQITHGFEGVNPAVLDAWRQARPSRATVDPGPEFLSRAQIAALWGIRVDSTSNRIRRMVAAGQLEKGYRTRPDARGRLREWPVYRLKETK